MSFLGSLWSSLSELAGHKLRSFLTLAGIILGTITLVVMTSLVDGVTGEVAAGFADLGFDGVFYVSEQPPRSAYETARFAGSEGLRPEDADLAAAHAETLSDFAPAHQETITVKANGRTASVRVNGVTPSYARVRNRFPAEGRFISDSDLRLFARTAVIGFRLKRRLFGSEPAIGNRVDVGGISMTVVGVGRDLTHQFFDDDELIREMEGCTVPLTTMERCLLGRRPLSFVAVKTNDPENLEGARREIDRLFTLAHRGVGDFRVQNIAEEILRARAETSTMINNWRIVLSSVAGISLLVGGIGLMSVMLISIGERTYEIGLRKAIGANNGEIFLQFLTESVSLALAGSAVGIAIGCGVNVAVGSFFKSGLPVKPSGILSALAVSILLGVGFGTYPALRASRLEPIDAIRAA